MSGSYYNAGTDTNYRYGQNQNHPTGPAEFFYGYVTKNDFFFKMCVVAFVVTIMLVVFLAGQSAQLSGGMVVGTILGILIGFYVMAPKTKTDESGEHVHRWWPWGQSPHQQVHDIAEVPPQQAPAHVAHQQAPAVETVKPPANTHHLPIAVPVGAPTHRNTHNPPMHTPLNRAYTTPLRTGNLRLGQYELGK